MSEDTYWLVALSLPGLALATAAGYATGAGCYAVYMNCFSVVVPDNATTRALFATAALLPFALPAYFPIAAAGLGLLRTRGVRTLERALWLAPPLYTLVLHLACVWFAGAVLPARRVVPTVRFDLAVLGIGVAYAGLAVAMRPALQRFLGRRRPHRFR
jgi:hypothetical protein